jgi:16S rRNA (guanine(966)-N(2))-methyltransferase RsmD
MRIISGRLKGRNIYAPVDISARPTTDFAKEGLFDVLNNRIDFEDIEVLDLFAGTGSIGFEFVSRGCRQVVSIENNPKQCLFIKKISEKFEIDNLILLKTDVFKYITHTASRFDLIFADPPYMLENLKEIPDMIFSQQLLKTEGIFILEHSSKYNFSQHPHFMETRKYGKVHFTFFKA